jgi:hypothetical protein
MRLLEEKEVDLTNSYIFLDANVLGFISNDPELFSDIITVSSGASLCLDPYIIFEFLRDSQSLSQAIYKQQLIESKLFMPTESHPETFKKINDNSLALSNIISFLRNKRGKKGKQGMSIPDTVDLFFAGNVIRFNKAFILTTNKPDFPSPLFQIHKVFQYESENDGTIKSLALLAFDKEAFGELVTEFNNAR